MPVPSEEQAALQPDAPASIQRPESVSAAGAVPARPPRVLFVCSGLTIGGAERQWSLLIPPLRAGGYVVSVLTLVAEGPYFDALVRAGVPATCARMRGRLDVGGLRRAFRHWRTKPDLVVTHSINAHVVGHLIARRAGVPHVTTEHGGPGIPTRFHRRALTRLVGPRVDRAIAVSASQIPRLTAFGYDPGRIRVVPNAVPEPTATVPPVEMRSGLGIAPGEFLAVLAARLRPEKTAHVFVRAVLDAHRREPRLRGLVVGGGPDLERLRRLAGSGGIVRVLGERSDVDDILGAADAVCLSSRAEGVPMIVLEAMALGKPVVATDVGGIPEAVEHGVTGLLVPPGDEKAFAEALIVLATDRARTERLGAGALQRSRDVFGFGRMIAGYSAVFEEVLRESATQVRR
jgi:glycosyltransferase involved in cell wall biosynthesis